MLFALGSLSLRAIPQSPLRAGYALPPLAAICAAVAVAVCCPTLLLFAGCGDMLPPLAASELLLLLLFAVPHAVVCRLW
jgi:hypothetical protein